MGPTLKPRRHSLVGFQGYCFKSMTLDSPVWQINLNACTMAHENNLHMFNSLLPDSGQHV